MRIEEVLQIKEQMLGDYSVQAVDGRSLWEALGVKSHFRDWMPKKLVEASAVLGKDYSEERRTNHSAVGGGGTDCRDYTLTLSLAKDIAMLSRGSEAQKVRDYFKACEATVQKTVQIQIATPESDFDARIEYINARSRAIWGSMFGVVNIISNAIQAQNEIAQKTGVTVELPDEVQTLIALNPKSLVEANPEVAIASKVAIGRNYTTVSQIAKDFYPLTSTDINSMLVNMGYLKKTGYSTYSVTKAGREFAGTRTLQSGPNKGTENVTGWNIDDLRFWKQFEEMLIAQRDIKKKQLALRKKI